MNSQLVKLPHRLGVLIFLVLGIGGCAATISKEGLEQRTAQALGREVSTFTISDIGEETGGRTNYTVKTNDNVTYRCYQYSPTGFQKAISFGQIPNSDAICTPMVRAGSGAASTEGRRPAGTCNALLKSAGRC
ncbi:hypothetical protein [Rhodoferax sp.]|uniref:hypothetical protein n=1 Tax=Rhodoferax sp. TaxID=50421 RepID=UPI002621D91F|nr:hypothetical protein [Rhodoferax sp.]MDD2925170.1 hypothetical protein [Rhodoferax sp.]